MSDWTLVFRNFRIIVLQTGITCNCPEKHILLLLFRHIIIVKMQDRINIATVYNEANMHAVQIKR